jgi:hypothetical protein
MTQVVQFLEGVTVVDMLPVPGVLNAITAAVGSPRSNTSIYVKHIYA